MKIRGFISFFAILILFSLGACEQKEGQDQGTLAPPAADTITQQQGTTPTPGAPTDPNITISPLPPSGIPPTGVTPPFQVNIIPNPGRANQIPQAYTFSPIFIGGSTPFTYSWSCLPDDPYIKCPVLAEFTNPAGEKIASGEFEAGIYRIFLSARDAAGARASDDITITVNPGGIPSTPGSMIPPSSPTGSTPTPGTVPPPVGPTTPLITLTPPTVTFVGVPLILSSNFDITVPLEKVYDQVFPQQPQIVPLGGIQFLGGATMRFKKTSTENFLETNFIVVVPTHYAGLVFPPSTPRNPNSSADITGSLPQPGRYSYVRMLNWFQLNLIACDQTQGCMVAKRNLPYEEQARFSAACSSNSGYCEVSYNVTVPGTDLPRGAVEKNYRYIIEIVATDKGDYLEAGATRACSSDQDCPSSYPACRITNTTPMTGLCNAIKGGAYFMADLPTSARP